MRDPTYLEDGQDAYFPVASAHGRFQPLHNDHLRYLLAAKARCDYLRVGVTQPALQDLGDIAGASSHRSVAADNPLTYDERAFMITEVLLDQGFSQDSFVIHPFPIEKPAHLREYLEPDVPVLTTVVDDWNLAKIRLLRAEHYRVEILYSRSEKGVTGSRVRELLAVDDLEYLELVPPATARLASEIRLGARIRGLRAAARESES